MSSGTVSGLITALLLVLFIGIVCWAWSRKRKASFSAAARLPLEEDADIGPRDGGGRSRE